MKKVILLLTLIYLSAYNCFAQYNVGIANGFSSDSFNQLSDLSGFAIFSVGNGQGYTQSASTVDLIPNVWKGTQNSNWENSANWHYQYIPNIDSDIYISDIEGHAPLNHLVLNSDKEIGSLFSANSAWNIDLNGYKLAIKGTISSNNVSKIDARNSNSIITFAGSATQDFSSDVFVDSKLSNLIINNPAHVNLSGNLNLTDTIASNSGRLNTVTNTATLTYAGNAQQTIGSRIFHSDQVYNLVIDNENGVIQNGDFTIQNNFTINAAKRYQINTNNCLTVNGTVTNNANSGGLIIKAASGENNGSFIFPQGQTVNATVEFFSKASWDKSDPVSTNIYKWQYFGPPATQVIAMPTFDMSYVRQYNEAGKGAGTNNNPVKRWLQLSRSSILSPFAGYEIVQQNPCTYSISGTLVNRDYNSGPMNYTTGADYPGMYILSNPYTASIDIANFRSEDFGTETEKTIYQYSTGSLYQWSQSSMGIGQGQYYAVPLEYAANEHMGLPRYISSMQGFMIRKLNPNTSNTENFTFKIPYNIVKVKNTTQQRIKAYENAYTSIEVSGSRFTDKVWLNTNEGCTNDFDNGFDAYKMSGSVLSPQIMMRENGKDYQINTLPCLNNATLAFKAGEDENYELVVSNHNTSQYYSTLYLIDLHEGITIDISGLKTTYSFSQQASSTPQERFRIVTQQDVSTSNNTQNHTAPIFVYHKNIVVDVRYTGKGILTLYNTEGKIVFKKEIESEHIENIKTSVVRGIYLVRFNADNGCFQKNVFFE